MIWRALAALLLIKSLVILRARYKVPDSACLRCPYRARCGKPRA